MNAELPWGLMIVIYLFTAGLSAGAMLTSNLAFLKNREQYERIARWGAFVAPFPIAIGTGMLLLDLGSPFNFYQLFLTLQVRSAMSYGSWAILLFTGLSFVNLYLWLPERYHILKWPGQIERWQRKLAKVMPVLSLIVASYTGVLLEEAARPLWNIVLLPVLFLVSALSTGVAAVILAAALSHKNRIQHHELRVLTLVDMILILVELALFLGIILMQQAASAAQRLASGSLLFGTYAWMFWLMIVVCGLLLPFSLEMLELKGRIQLRWALPATFGSSLLVLLGGFFVRYVLTYAGQLNTWLN